jgi:hypothetical protein
MLYADVYPALVYQGQRTGDWLYVRMTRERYNKAPVENVLSDAIRCNVDPSGPVAQTLTVSAGQTLGFVSDSGISHPGPLLFYMAKVPQGQTAASWDGTGTHWFKIYQDRPTIQPYNIQGPSLGKFSCPGWVPIFALRTRAC